MFGNIFQSHQSPLEEAVTAENYDRATQMIEDGHDPFQTGTGIFNDSTAFHAASKKGNLNLMLRMVAAPGTPWTQRFFVTRNKFIIAPVYGRECISSASSQVGHFFFEGLSKEAVEIMVMFGYRLKSRDIQKAVSHEATHSDGLLKLCLACLDSEFDVKKLGLSFGLAIGGNHQSFINNSHPSSLASAEMLLKLGVSPNAYCFQGETPYDFCPALYQAIKNRDGEMIKLLMKYGADPSKNVQISSWNDDGELDVESFSVASVAGEYEDLLQVPSNIVSSDRESYVKELRNELVPLVAETNGIVVVAMMRATGEVPPLGILVPRIKAEYCALW